MGRGKSSGSIAHAGIGLDDRGQNIRNGIASEDLTAGEHLHQYRAERPDVTAAVGGTTGVPAQDSCRRPFPKLHRAACLGT